MKNTSPDPIILKAAVLCNHVPFDLIFRRRSNPPKIPIISRGGFLSKFTPAHLKLTATTLCYILSVFFFVSYVQFKHSLHALIFELLANFNQ